EDDQGDRKEPQQRQSGGRTEDAVRRDAAGIVARDAGDQPGAHHREERQQSPAAAEPAAQPDTTPDLEAFPEPRGRDAEGQTRVPAFGTRRRHEAGRIVSIASSTVTIPTRRPF